MRKAQESVSLVLGVFIMELGGKTHFSANPLWMRDRVVKLGTQGTHAADLPSGAMGVRSCVEVGCSALRG